MDIIRLEDCRSDIFEQICIWYYDWLGKKNGESFEEVKYTFLHSINTDRLPRTYVALIGKKAVGMYQLSISDDLKCRPDLYPWLINVYVDEKFRGKNVCGKMMQSVYENAKKAGMKELYLYTGHVGLYEKYGWKFMGEEKTFKADSPTVRLYFLNLRDMTAK